VAHGKVNHALGWINAENRTLRKSSHDFRSDLSIAASEIEKSLRSVEMQQGEHFGGHGLLKSPPPTLFFGIPSSIVNPVNPGQDLRWEVRSSS
jgi:hypothetical protein